MEIQKILEMYINTNCQDENQIAEKKTNHQITIKEGPLSM